MARTRKSLLAEAASRFGSEAVATAVAVTRSGPTRFGVVRISPKRYQAATFRMKTGRGDIMLEDWDVFGPKFADWRQAHDYAVAEMTDAERAAHKRDDEECVACGLQIDRCQCGGNQRGIGTPQSMER